MAERIHISLKAWQKMENGTTKLDFERLEQIANVLGTSLLEITWNICPEHKQQEFVLNYIAGSKLPDEERQLYERLIADKEDQIDFYKNLLKSEMGVSRELCQF